MDIHLAAYYLIKKSFKSAWAGIMMNYFLIMHKKQNIQNQHKKAFKIAKILKLKIFFEDLILVFIPG